jgi:hypothetical protein
MGTDDDRDDQRQADEPVRCTWTSAEAQARWGLQQFREYRREARAGVNFDGLIEEIAEYDSLLRQHCGVTLAEAVVFEIGFGARPSPACAAEHRNQRARRRRRGAGHTRTTVTVRDHVAPQWCGARRQVTGPTRALRPNRGTRSSVRCANEGSPRASTTRLIVADARVVEVEPESLDLVISEDVFEHLQRDTVEQVVAAMARWLRPTGIALRPNVFTGITGGHLIEWSRQGDAPAAARAPQRAMGASVGASIQGQHLPE